MAIRLIAVAIATTAFLIVGLFMFVALRGPADSVVARDSPSASNSAPSSTTTRRIGRFTVTAITTLRSGDAELALSIRDERGGTITPQDVPSAVLQMNGMGSIPVVLQETSSGVWRGSGRPSMSGRWSFVVVIEGQPMSVPIDIP